MIENWESKSRVYFSFVLKDTKDNGQKYGGEGEKESKYFWLPLLWFIFCHQRSSDIFKKSRMITLSKFSFLRFTEISCQKSVLQLCSGDLNCYIVQLHNSSHNLSVMTDLVPCPCKHSFIAEPLCYYNEGSKSCTYLSLGGRTIQRLPLINCLLAVSFYILYSGFTNWFCLLPHWLVFVLKHVYEKKVFCIICCMFW